MKVKIKKLEDTAILPVYASEGAAGFDLYALNTVSVPAGRTVKMRTGLAFEIPFGYEMQIRPRSGLSAKTSLRVSNSPGTIDSDYRGEIIILIDNIAQNQAESYKINRGDRIAQGVITKIEKVAFEPVEELGTTIRGVSGFGSTGV